VRPRREAPSAARVRTAPPSTQRSASASPATAGRTCCRWRCFPRCSSRRRLAAALPSGSGSAPAPASTPQRGPHGSRPTAPCDSFDLLAEDTGSRLRHRTGDEAEGAKGAQWAHPSSWRGWSRPEGSRRMLRGAWRTSTRAGSSTATFGPRSASSTGT
jgi:hypothetical protein